MLSWSTASELTFDAGSYLNLRNDITNTTGSVEFIGRLGIRSANGVGNITITRGGDITFTASNMGFDGFISNPSNGTVIINSTGHLTIQPYDQNFTSNTLRGADGGTGTTL